MDSYSGKYQILWPARETEQYSIPGKFTLAKLHPIKVETWHNVIQSEILQKFQNYWSKKIFEPAIFYQHPVSTFQPLQRIEFDWLEKWQHQRFEIQILID